MITRRKSIAALVISLAGPLSVLARPEAVPRIGVLVTVDLERTRTRLLTELRGLGYVDGLNVFVEFRLVKPERADQLPELAAELVQLPVDVIIAQFTTGATAAKRATTEIPIVMYAVGNPVETGLITSLARPGGNVTGVAALASESAAKALELLHELIPSVRRVAVLLNSKVNLAGPLLEQIRLAASADSFDIQPVQIGSIEELEAVFLQLSFDHVDALFIQPSLPTRRAAELALQYRLPAVSIPRWFAEDGGLMAYGWDTAGVARQVVAYVDKILKGAKPADLPVEQPTDFKLIINRNTARTLGLTIPPSLLIRVDEIIE
ncbi:MAG TPA: ABC transporter substrate-binding protein [Bradyrhizobium sp.]|nr:ABC transporter substrate-binding protein [Bradyrhizobium sp.]